MDLSLIFMQVVYCFMCLEWGRIKGNEFLYTHSSGTTFYKSKGFIITVFHTIAAPISVLWDLYKS